MATNTVHIDASPADVFAALSDGWLYSNWVVGTSHMRAVEHTWPAVGSRLYHAAGVWPLVRRDNTVVDAVEQDRRLELTARGRPFGEAKVVLELAADAGGTTVTMHEVPSAGPGKWLDNPAVEALLARRNRETLARLKVVVERPGQPREKS